MSHFFAYLARMKYIQRWGLMRNTMNENIQEHSLQTAMIAHALAVIRSRCFGGDIDADRAAVLGIFHECSEVITGDIATPIKYFNPDIKEAYKELEKTASQKLFDMLPEELSEDYESLFKHKEDDKELWKIVKAADRICAYLKCLEEQKAGNGEFSKALGSIKKSIDALDMQEVDYFMDRFARSFTLTLDELN